ncbi:MAG: hypothetical protein ACYDCJ_03700 [Gammaproteobacteria bacterium]
MESERSDALFYNPFAHQLAGERGAKIVRDLAASVTRGWPIEVRTQVLVELILNMGGANPGSARTGKKNERHRRAGTGIAGEV